ncbi:glycosyltransferase family 4 protein [Siphonobacter sp. SORGH_AS_1065]|uniref:glycosyltransferase family 4 protein n=1 Tax=Siphonobacter sp. SORGH_AS_1065 TaxID=3041795 RepID=UPI00278A32B1|nr:glycosyltransferase family 4 protein [Siphonobacter sp. SORGH_AS_1065]MDQ1088721.1 glycosyltransferase involved in cell wall biosynthesis [Siphonobacter sp. SORGH_AS_1065]
MRVLIVHNILWSHYKAALFSELAQQCPVDCTLLVVQLAESEDKYNQLGKSGLIEHQYPYHLLHPGSLNSLSFSKKITGLISQINQFNPDIVNLSGYYDPAYWLLIGYCRLRGIKLVLSNESSEKDGSRNGWKEKFKRTLIRQFAGFINFGSSSAEYMLKMGARSSQIITQHAAVLNNTVVRQVYDRSIHSRQSLKEKYALPAHNFIFVGRLAEEKNLPALLSAFSWLKENDPKAHDWGLIIIGDGPLRAQLNTSALKDVFWLGGQPWNEVPAYLALADALVLPSHFEPWGLVVNEAMVCGLPVVVSNQCGCVNDLVEEEKNGYTFRPEVTLELGVALQKFVNLSEAERTQMGQHSLKLIAPFHTTTVAQEIWQGFRRIGSPTEASFRS